MSLEPEAELFTDSSPFLERGGPVEVWETERARRNPCYLSTFANHAAPVLVLLPDGTWGRVSEGGKPVQITRLPFKDPERPTVGHVKPLRRPVI